MTFNVAMSEIRQTRERILERIKDFNNVLVAENMWFNGTVGGKQIIGLGFHTEEERLMFIVEFKSIADRCEPTDKEFKWGLDIVR